MIYIQSNNKIPMWDFGSHALHGCLNTGKSYRLCEDWNMPGSDATCLIGSVEWCTKWLNEHEHKVPEAIDWLRFKNYFRRDCSEISSKDFLECNNVCLSVDDTLEWCKLLDLTFVPIWYRGRFDLEFLRTWITDPNTQEGYVVRKTKSFHYNDFQNNVAKWVRKGHVQTDQHWLSKPVIKNRLLNSY